MTRTLILQTALVYLVVQALLSNAHEDPPTLSRIGVNKDGLFVDQHGRVRIFHGINMLYKQKPWYDAHMLNETWLKNFREWGFNSVRYGAMWAGVEPSKDQYNDTYIGVLKRIVTSLEEYGVYSLLDLHQDVLSSAFTSYDGVPRWLYDSLPKSSHAYPWPFPQGYHFPTWAESYVAQAVGEAFQDIYDNVSGSRDELVQFWEKMASVFVDQPAILGYDLFNEPWAGDVFSKPSLILPGNAGKDNLMPLYNILNEAIRKIDKDTILFYEPVTWGVFGWGDTGTGFTTVPGGPMYCNVSALSYHYYCWVLTSSDEGHDYPFWKKMVCDDLFLRDMASQIVSDVKLTGGGAFLTEFGLCNPDGKNTTGTIECEAVMSAADENLQSWCYLSDFYDSKGHVMWDDLRPFSRPYPRVTSGTPTKMSFNVNTAEFYLEFTTNPNISSDYAQTEIFIPKLHYPNGIIVVTKPDVPHEYSNENNVIVIRTATFTSPTKIKVSVTKK